MLTSLCSCKLERISAMREENSFSNIENTLDGAFIGVNEGCITLGEMREMNTVAPTQLFFKRTHDFSSFASVKTATSH